MLLLIMPSHSSLAQALTPMVAHCGVVMVSVQTAFSGTTNTRSLDCVNISRIPVETSNFLPSAIQINFSPIPCITERRLLVDYVMVIAAIGKRTITSTVAATVQMDMLALPRIVTIYTLRKANFALVAMESAKV